MPKNWKEDCLITGARAETLVLAIAKLCCVRSERGQSPNESAYAPRVGSFHE